jgi:hypothetical protein
VSDPPAKSDTPSEFTMHLQEVASPDDTNYILWKVTVSATYSNGATIPIGAAELSNVYFGQLRQVYNIKGNKLSPKKKYDLKWETGERMRREHPAEWNKNVIHIVSTRQFFHPARFLYQSRGCFISCIFPRLSVHYSGNDRLEEMHTGNDESNRDSIQNLQILRDLYNSNSDEDTAFTLKMNSIATYNTEGLIRSLIRQFNNLQDEIPLEIQTPIDP